MKEELIMREMRSVKIGKKTYVLWGKDKETKLAVNTIASVVLITNIAYYGYCAKYYYGIIKGLVKH